MQCIARAAVFKETTLAMQQRPFVSTSVVLVEKLQACLFDQQRCVWCRWGCTDDHGRVQHERVGGRWVGGGGRSMRKHEEAILAGRVVFKLALSHAGCIKCVL